MEKGRLEAFSDGVIAILITIMVLELKVPHGADWASLVPLLPIFLSYVLSFVFLGIYWSNHHHLLQAVEQVNGAVLWSNLHLLFWLSLIPFVTGWMGENGFGQLPVMLYGVVLWLAAIAYYLLTRTLISLHGRDSTLARALRRKGKEYTSLVLYTAAIPLSLVSPAVSMGLYVLVTVIWLIPDPRIEKKVMEEKGDSVGPEG
ncbi:MAG: TMEM175 family protein [Bacteroidota bacterium]